MATLRGRERVTVKMFKNSYVSDCLHTLLFLRFNFLEVIIGRCEVQEKSKIRRHFYAS